jgi:hypothetical protein
MRHVVAILLLLSVATRAAAAIPSRFESIARRFMVNFGAGRLDAAAKDFNAEMKATVTPEVLANFKQQFDRDLGHYMSVTAVHAGSDGAFPLIEMTSRFEKGSALVQVIFDAEGKIGSLHFDRVATNDPALERTARAVLAAFNGGRFAEIGKYLDEKMNAQLPPSALESLYTDVTAIYGKFKAVTQVTYTTQRDLRIVNIFADYEKAPMLFEVVFNSSGRVAGWSFRPPR